MAKKLFFVISEDWFFRSHFAERARAAVQAGYDVRLVTHINPDTPKIEISGLRVIPWRFSRGSLNPFEALHSIWQLHTLYKTEQPDIVYSVALKPILLSGLAARMLKPTAQVFAPVGLGYIFTATSLKAKLLRPFISLLLKRATTHQNSFTIFENQDDRAKWLELNLAKQEATIVIPGAGVDVSSYQPNEQALKTYNFIMVSRLLWEKGVGTFVEAARLAKSRGKTWSFVLVGASDKQNHGAVPSAKLEQWHAGGDINWLGQRDDVAALLQSSEVYVLPSAYGEGLPKSILEAMSCGLPVVTTNTPGCRDAVINGKNGLLVPPKNPEALLAAMQELAESQEKRSAMGAASRQMVLEEFSSQRVIEQTLAVWTELCPPHPSQHLPSA
jgi:glycosyltransferase involved in cell wall biosynthesis